MEGTMAEIRCFAADFAPRNWAFCSGQMLAISTNQALFALLGTTYGGNGTQTFGLPDLRSRIPMGTGQPTYGGANFVTGEKAGEENHLLIIAEITAHQHSSSITAGTGPAMITSVLNATSTGASTTVPAGQIFGADGGNGDVTLYAPSTTPVAMAAAAVAISDITPSTAAASLLPTGANQAHSNIQPVLGLNYIICTMGIFPSRN